MVNPIKQWYATNNDGYKFAYGPDSYNPGDGWTQGSIVFWAYATEQSETVGIKQWYATNNDGYKFAYGPDGYNPGDGWTQGGIVFWAYPDLQWNITYEDLVFDTAASPPTVHEVVSSRTLVNKDSKASQEQAFEFSTERTSTFEWGLTEKLHVGTTLNFKAGTPFTEAGAQLEIGLDLESHQTKTTSKTITYSATTTITVPAQDAVIATGYIDWAEDVSTPFKLHINIAPANPPVNRIPGSVISDMFLAQNPEAKLYKAEDYDRAIFSLSGFFRGSYGLRLYSEVKPAELVTA